MRFTIIRNDGDGPLFDKYAELILLLSHLESFLQQVIVFVILGTKFDPNNISHAVLSHFVYQSSFERNLQLIKSEQLLSVELLNKLESIRNRRNIFIHGIILSNNDKSVIKIRHKQIQQDFNLVNVKEFLDFVELTGGELVTEFKLKGFILQ